MPVYKNSGRNKKGALFFVYDITGDSISKLAERMSMTADRPIEYRGRYNDGQLQISAFQVEELINAGGQVACQTSVGGVSCIARILEPSEIIVIPSDGNQATADYLVGADGHDDYDDYDDSEYDDFDFDDEYGGAQSTANADDNGIANVMPHDQYSQAADPRASGMPPYHDSMIAEEPRDKRIGIGEWLVTLILLMIPLVNIVFIIVMLAGKKTSKTKKSFIIAEIILAAIQSVIVTAIMLVGGGAAFLQAAHEQDAVTPVEQVQQQRGSGDEGNAGAQNDPIGTSSSSTNSNGVSDATRETANSANSGSMSVVQFGDSSASGSSKFSAVLDNIAIVDKANGGKVAIVTATVANNSDSTISPASVLDVTGHQGNINLTPYMEAQESFKPETFTSDIAPGTNGTFQVGYELSNDDKFRFLILDKDTRATLLDQTQS